MVAFPTPDDDRCADCGADYRDIVENAADMIITVGLDGLIRTANAAFLRVLGWDPGELVGSPFASLVAPSWRAQTEDAVTAKLSGRMEQTVYDVEFLTRAGATVPVEVSSWLVRVDGEPVATQAICRDVRERDAAARALRIAEEALYEREDLLRRAFEDTAIGMVVLTPKGRIVTANHAFAELLGYEHEELWSVPIAELTHPEDREALRHALPRLLSGEARRISSEKRYVRKDGGVVYVQVGTSPVRNSAGRVTSLVAQVVDVTGLRDADAAMRESEALFRAAFEDAAIGMIMTTPAGNIVRANPRFCELFGYDEGELRRMDVIELTYADDRSTTRSVLQRMRGGDLGRHVVEKRYVHKDGRPRWVQIAVSPVHDSHGELRCHVTQVLDLDESRAIKERFRLLFESSPHGMDIIDNQGRMLQANGALARILGYERDELLELSIVDFTHPDDYDSDLNLYKEMMEGRRSYYALDKRCVRKDGHVVWVHLTSFALPDAGPLPRFAFGILEDITERRELESQLRRSQRLEAVGQLAGGVSHDFNNLLTAIANYCDLASQSLPANADERLATSIAGIRGVADLAAGLTRQLLAFSRQQVLEPTVLDPNAVVTGDAPMLRRLLGEDVEVRLALDPNAATVLMDAGQLTQILVNLAVNARDAMPDGGTLTIETENVDLRNAPTTTGSLDGPHVLLAVSDTGCGMDTDTIGRIFEPFFTTKEPGKGTGLGLATVIGIVEQSGGRVSVYSEPGVGTTFKVYLPRAAATAAPSAAEDASSARPPGSESILLVEDNDAVRETIGAVLADLGYRVLAAADPDEALRLAETDEEGIDLLVTDVVMPSMNGRQLAEALLQGRPELKVLYMSGYTDDAVLVRGVVEPGTAFLQKPFGADRLAQTLRELLDA